MSKPRSAIAIRGLIRELSTKTQNNRWNYREIPPALLARKSRGGLPARCAGWHATEGRFKGRGGWKDSKSARKETVTAAPYPGFPSNCYSDPGIRDGWRRS